MLESTSQGWFCAQGGFHVDPSAAVDRALITHAHSDHARSGSRHYLCHEHCVELLKQRVGRGASVEGVRYGEKRTLNGVEVSFHPAGHILGSSQIRMEYRGEIWVVSGDYKVQKDVTCEAFEAVRCHHFITESTFALPVYEWAESGLVMAEMHRWWAANQRDKRTSLMWAYSLGKAQRVLAGLDGAQGQVLVHASIQSFLPYYRAAGVRMAEVETVTPELLKAAKGQALVICPPGAAGAAWLREAGEVSEAMASGWMLLRGPRRRQGLESGFALSDHADWRGLLGAIAATGAERVWVTHGYAGVLARWLVERGVGADVVHGHTARVTEGEET